MEWDTLAKERRLKNIVSKIIFYDVLLYGCTAKQFLAYFRTFLDVLEHQRATLKLKISNSFNTGMIFCCVRGNTTF